MLAVHPVHIHIEPLVSEENLSLSPVLFNIFPDKFPFELGLSVNVTGLKRKQSACRHYSIQILQSLLLVPRCICRLCQNVVHLGNPYETWSRYAAGRNYLVLVIVLVIKLHAKRHTLRPSPLGEISLIPVVIVGGRECGNLEQRLVIVAHHQH